MNSRLQSVQCNPISSEIHKYPEPISLINDHFTGPEAREELAAILNSQSTYLSAVERSAQETPGRQDHHVLNRKHQLQVFKNVCDELITVAAENGLKVKIETSVSIVSE